MTKDGLRMLNNELEARVIELESQLACAKQEAQAADDKFELEADAAQMASDDLRGEVAGLEAEMDAHGAVTSIGFDEWYARLHPTPGCQPDLKWLERTKHARIIA